MLHDGVIDPYCPTHASFSNAALDDLQSEHLHQLYLATGTMLARISEYMDQSGHEDFVTAHRERMRMIFEQVPCKYRGEYQRLKCDHTSRCEHDFHPNCAVAGL